MAEESFLLVSLEQQKSKKLAEVISNDTCRRILEALARKEMTETQISTDLNIPLSTVHYNLKNLVEAKLVLANEYHYSTRGKEIIHYKIANKLIIIAPQESEATKIGDLLKKYLPVSGIILAIGIVIQLVQDIFSNVALSASTVSMKMADVALENSPAVASEGGRLMAAAPAAFSAQASPATIPQIAPWFLIGAFCALLIFLTLELMKNNKKQHKDA
jgi:DNA-binding transcriptional ArsR family regulator